MTEVDPVRLPSRLAARFRLLGVIGRGAGSVVHRAHDDLLDRAAVIKIVSVVPHSRRDLGRFAALDHPHLVPVIDVELDEHADGGPRAVIVTDPSGGGDLRSRIARGPLDLVDALVCAAAVADALDHAHRAGVAHLAVAPGNVLFDEDGRARLADTGLAAVTARSSAGFLAPEQEGEDEKSAGSPADVHALGLVLVASLTGRPDGPDGPDGPDAERPEQVPDALRGVVDRMLAPDPAARPLAGEVTVALRRAALAVDPAASAFVVASAPTIAPRAPAHPTRPPVPRGLLLAAAAAVTALLAGSVVLASTWPVEEIASDTPPAVSAVPAQSVVPVPPAPGPEGPVAAGGAGGAGSTPPSGDGRPAGTDGRGASTVPASRPSVEPVAVASPSSTPRSSTPRSSAPPVVESTSTSTTTSSPTAVPTEPSTGTPSTSGVRSPGLLGRLLGAARSAL